MEHLFNNFHPGSGYNPLRFRTLTDGFQFPRSGTRFTRISSWFSFNRQMDSLTLTENESIQTRLAEPMISNRTYYFEMFASRLSSLYGASRGLGVHFSNNLYDTIDINNININLHIVNQNFILNTQTRVKVSGT